MHGRELSYSARRLFLAQSFFVDIVERQIHFDQFLAVFEHGVWWFVVVNRYRIIYEISGGITCIFWDFLGMVLVFHPLPALWIPAYAGMTGRGGCVGLLFAPPFTSGLRIKSAMTGRWWCCIVSPSPLIPLPSRERGKWLVWTCCCPATPLDCGSSPQ